MWKIIHNERVNEILTARGYNVYSVREPGGVPISESIRNIIMDNKTQIWMIDVKLCYSQLQELN